MGRGMLFHRNFKVYDKHVHFNYILERCHIIVISSLFHRTNENLQKPQHRLNTPLREKAKMTPNWVENTFNTIPLAST